jgi:hypothetical protein
MNNCITVRGEAIAPCLYARDGKSSGHREAGDAAVKSKCAREATSLFRYSGVHWAHLI